MPLALVPISRSDGMTAQAVAARRPARPEASRFRAVWTTPRFRNLIPREWDLAGALALFASRIVNGSEVDLIQFNRELCELSSWKWLHSTALKWDMQRDLRPAKIASQYGSATMNGLELVEFK